VSKNFKIKNGLETTNITASSNISSSGTITSTQFNAGNKQSVKYFANGDQIRFGNATQKTSIRGATATIVPNITASGDISSSGTITAATLDAAAVSDGLAAAIVAEIDNDEISGDKINGGTIGSTTITALAGNLSLGDNNITNVGSLAADSIVVDDAAQGLNITFGGNTTKNKITLTDNLADALNITEGSNSYIKFTTTNSSEKILVSKDTEFLGDVSGSSISTGSFGRLEGNGAGLTNVSATLPGGVVSSSAAGSSQGKFKLNGVDVDVNGLGTNGDPTFDTLTLDAGGLKGVGAFSSSAQLPSGIFSASAAGSSQGKFKLNGVDVDVNGLGTDGDVTFDTLTLDAGGLKGAGVFSSSAQLPAGLVSASSAGSSQGKFKLNGVDVDVNGLGTDGDVTFDTLTLDAGGLKGAGVISSSAQIATDISGSIVESSASFSTRVSANEVVTAKTLVSSSAQINSLINDTIAATIVGEIDNDEIPIAKLASDAITIGGAGSTTLGGTATVANILKGSTTISSSAQFGSSDNVQFNQITASGNLSASGTTTLKTLTIKGLSNQGSEATAVMINGSSVVGTRELGSNAFTSTTIGTTTNALTAGDGLNNGGGTFTGATARTFSVNSASIAPFFSASMNSFTTIGNISSSAGTVSAEHLFSSDDAEITADLSVGGVLSVAGDIRHIGDTDTKIVFGTDSIAFRAGATELLKLTEASTDTISFGAAISSHITASGNISGSNGNILGFNNITIVGTGSAGYLTANEISASGTIKAVTLDAAAVTDGLAAAIVAEIDNDEIPIAKLAEDAITIAGTSTVLGGSITADTIAGQISADTISGNQINGGTINAVTISDLTATKLNVTHFTSSFITSSTIQTEGSNIFGDAIIDTHLFNGHITASGNISASGNGFFDDLTVKDDLVVGDDIFLSDSVVHSGDTDTKIAFATDKITLAAGGVDMITLTEATTDTIALGAAISSHITASGNISSSGTIKAATLDADAVTDGLAAIIVAEIDNDEIPIAKLAEDAVTVTAGTGLTGGGSITLGGSATVNVIGGDGITANANDVAITAAQTTITSIFATDLKIGEDDQTKIDFEDTNQINFYANNTEVADIKDGGINVNGHITASGNISASGNILTSGNITSLGTITAEQITSTDDITALGDISSSGTLISKNINVAEKIIHLGDANTEIAFTSDQITFTAGAVEMIRLVEGSNDAVVVNDLSADMDFRVESNANTHMLFVDGGNNTVGINMALPSASLDITGDLRVSSHITASGNISASGDVIALTGTGSFGEINLEDNKKIKIGTGDDLHIWHNGSNSYIQDKGTGALYIDGTEIRVRAQNNGNTIAVFTQGAGTELKHNNSTKFETSDGGINVTGHITASGVVSASGGFVGDGSNLSNVSATIGGNTFATDLKIGRDADNLIDFTTDNQIQFRVNAGNELKLNNAALFPAANDGHSLGSAGLAFSDLFLADAAVINFNNGEINLTQTDAALVMSGSGTTTLEVKGNITVDGNLSNVATTHITASGNISSSGELSANTVVVGSTITHIGDTNTLISFGTDTLTFKAGNEAFITITEDGSQDNIVVGDGGDIDFHVKAGGSNTLFAQGSSQNIGIGTATPTEKLEIVAGGRIKVTPGTDATGSILSLANDQDVLLSSQNDSATNDPQQFVLKHNAGATELINRRGDLILSASGDITTTDNLEVQGNISGSGASNLTIGGNATINGNIDLEGDIDVNGTANLDNIDVDGTSNFADNITIAENKAIFFDSTDTFIKANTGAAEDLVISADEDIILAPDDNIQIEHGATAYAEFMGDERELRITGNVSASGFISTNTNITASGNLEVLGNISGSGTSTITIGGKLIAGSKSFVINKPEGGKLEYGVLEGQQNDVFYRGELKGDNVIYLPKEWEWLVDENTITTQLTSIGKHQELFVKEIKENKIFIDINGMFKTKENIHCYYIIHGTRKDIELIRNHQW